MDKNLLIRFFEGQATTDEEMKVRKWMEASTENRRTYFKERKMYDMTLLLSKDTKKETVSQSSKKKFKFKEIYRNCSSCSDYSGHHTILQEPRATRILAHCSKNQCSSWSTYQFGIV